jgi:hypothetical protein
LLPCGGFAPFQNWLLQKGGWWVLSPKRDKQTDIINNGLHAAQVLKYSTNASPKFHGEREVLVFTIRNIPVFFLINFLFFLFFFVFQFCDVAPIWSSSASFFSIFVMSKNKSGN